MEETNAKLTTELQMLQLKRNKTKSALEKGNLDKILRHKEALRIVVRSVEELKTQLEKARLEKGETLEEVEKWGAELEEKIDETDVEIAHLESCLGEAATKAEDEIRYKEKVLLDQKRAGELQFEKLKLQQKTDIETADNETSSKPSQAKGGNVKMPKLVITKYDGTFEKWLSFWNKFEAEIDATDLPAVTKFSYLKELLETKVCEEIDGLPFSVEGYTRAKNILKTNHGNESEIVRAYVRNLQELPTVTGSQPSKIHPFCQTLNYNVQSLETLGKLSQCLSMVRGLLDKLPGIKAELVNNKPGWQDWGFTELMQALENWKVIHPVESSSKPIEKPQHHKSFFSKDQAPPTRGCVYCEDEHHRSYECKKIVTPAERKQKLQSKKLCFNCTGNKHHAAQCRSRVTCFHCKQKHHSSICEKAPQTALTATQKGEKVCHPIVVVKANGIICRALLDTGATVSYASAYLLDLLKLAPSQSLTRQIQTITGIITKQVKTYNLQVSDTEGKSIIPVSVTRVERDKLLSVDNPNYADIISRYAHLKGVRMEDKDLKSLLPVHLILGAGEYSKIKTSVPQRTGSIGQPVAELTLYGWTLISSGKEAPLKNMLLTQTAQGDYEELCRMDILGLKDTPIGDQQAVHAEFLEQLHRSPEGWYETGLPWKGDHPPLPSNKANSLKRLGSLVQRLKKTEKLNAYDSIIQDQLKTGVVEEAEQPATGKEFYLPHRAVMRESAESTKIRIVYDASTKTDTQPSLNECLEIGPPLQNQLFKVLVRGRFHPVVLAGDICKAFLQVRIRPEDRDVLRFHWLKEKNPQHVCTLRFTRALFGLVSSPFLLAGVLKHHLDTCREKYPKRVPEIEQELYVDDLLIGGTTVQQVYEKKRATMEIFNQASFQLHKWHSNAEVLEKADTLKDTDELSYAKQQLGDQSSDCKLLGLRWNKEADTLAVTIQTDETPATKRGILGKVARIYDPLGLAAPTTLQGKLLYREACNEKCNWDQLLSQGLVKRWQKWKTNLPQEIQVPRALTCIQEPIQDIALHGFGDASGKGVAAAVYAVVTQHSKLSQGLVSAKSRLAKEGLTIPRRELVSGHMAVNLLSNIREAMQGFPITSLHCWLDSSVALHWIHGDGNYKQFVANRVRKIREHEDVTWRHVPTHENPADLASRGGPVEEGNQLWWKGPTWLNNPEEWPPNIVTAASAESQAESKEIKQLFALAVKEEDELDILRSKFSYWRTLRIFSWISRFICNARSPKNTRMQGPLSTEEMESQELLWVLRAQSQGSANFERDSLQLNLQKNQHGVLECRGRVQGFYPIYIPDSSNLAEKFVQHAHKAALHGGVGITMVKVRERHWIPRLRRLVRQVIKKCLGCKRFHAIAYATPPPGNLPTTRTEGTTAFQVIGIDYAGPLRYRISKGKEGKSYVLLYACSLTRGIYLDLLPSLEMPECLDSLQRFIARRGRPERIYSDNGATFIGAAKWVRMVMRNEPVQSYLAKYGIRWQFNLSRAPWWGGQFERMIGLVKSALFKVIGHGQLSWKELEKVLLSVEISLNDRPLGYVEEDVQYPTITPNSFLFLRPNYLLEPPAHLVEDNDLRKRYKYLLRCKQAMWKRWTTEYLRALRERYICNKKGGRGVPQIGEVVIIKSEEKNRGKWALGIVQDLIMGRDGVIRGAKLRTGKSNIERPVQFLYPLELSCNREYLKPEPATLNLEATDFRPKRRAAVTAEHRIREIAEDEQNS